MSGDHLEPARFKVDEARGQVGYINGEVKYDQDPQTAYQKWCRETSKHQSDLQHFTQSFNKDTVKQWVSYVISMIYLTMHRVVNVPLESGADYRSIYISCFFLPSDTDQLLLGLNPEIQQYQTSHPLSGVARGGFKAGMIHKWPTLLQ